MKNREPIKNSCGKKKGKCSEITLLPTMKKAA
jgi:hypothetical protein